MGERLRATSDFTNKYCLFTPYEWVEIGRIKRPVIFKVVTKDLRSLGLRKNPNIMTFKIDDWVLLADDQVSPGKKDWGGIWSALKFSGARTLSKYMMDQYRVPTRIFSVALENPLYANSYRVKSQGVMLLREVTNQNI